MDQYYYLVRDGKDGEAVFICSGPGDVRLESSGSYCRTSHDEFDTVYWAEYISESQYETYLLFGVEICDSIKAHVFNGGDITITAGNGYGAGNGGAITITGGSASGSFLSIAPGVGGYRGSSK